LSSAFFEDSDRYNILEDLKDCAKPKLFILGIHDKTVKPEVVMEAYEAAAEPKELCRINSAHDYRWHPHLIEEINQVLGNFIHKNQI